MVAQKFNNDRYLYNNKKILTSVQNVWKKKQGNQCPKLSYIKELKMPETSDDHMEATSKGKDDW